MICFFASILQSYSLPCENKILNSECQETIYTKQILFSDGQEYEKSWGKMQPEDFFVIFI